MEEYQRYIPSGGFTKKVKAIFEDGLQDVVPAFYLPNRKALKTEQQFEDLCKDINFKVVGDPVGIFHSSYKHLLLECKSCGNFRNAALTDIRNSSVACSWCLRLRLGKEAENAGLKLLGDSTNGKSAQRFYQFVACGHVRNINTADVRLNSVSCSQCREEKLRRLLNEKGFKLTDPNADLKEGNTVRATYVECGHERTILKSHLENSTIGGCDICYNKEIQEKYGDPQGIEVLSVQPSATRLIKFNACGHTRLVGLSNLKSGSVTCQTCIEDKWKAEANDAELTWISRSVGRYSKYLASCGHEIIAKPAHIRIGHWTCRECNSGWVTKPSYIYLFKVVSGDFSFLKLGYSLKPEYRKYDYVLSDTCQIDLLYKVKIDSGLQAMRLENALHNKYKEFNFPPSVIRQYLTESGFSECYPDNLQGQFLEELERIEIDQQRRTL